MPTVEQFSCLTEAKVVIEDWRVDYNEPRPRPVLGDKSSARLARAAATARCSPRSPYGLTPRDGATPTLRQTTLTDFDDRWSHKRVQSRKAVAIGPLCHADRFQMEAGLAKARWEIVRAPAIDSALRPFLPDRIPKPRCYRDEQNN